MTYPSLVSVIIPVYNVASYLRRAIDSIINQTYNNLEIIIVDDGSTDESGIICDRYHNNDSRIRVIHQDNRGLSGARNTGLVVAQGEYVVFLDPDDMMLSNMIEEMVKSISRFRADIVVCGYYVCDTRFKDKHIEKKLFSNHPTLLSTNSALSQLIEKKINIHVWNKMYRRLLFNNLRFPEGHVYEDHILVPYVFEQANSVLLIEKPLIKYRKRYGSISTTNSNLNACDWLYSQKTKEDFVIKRTPKIFSSRQKCRFFEKQFCDIIRHYLEMLDDEHISARIKEQYRKEIELRAKLISSYSLKTKIIYYLFSINPYLCLYVRKMFGLIKKPFTF